MVCMIGVMVPNAFGAWWIANVESCNDYGTWNEQTKTCTLTSDVDDFILIKCKQLEFRNESGGTAFTDGHAQMLKRLTRNVQIAYDGDSAGISSTIKAGYVLLKNGLNPSIIEIPDGKDPDD